MYSTTIGRVTLAPYRFVAKSRRTDPIRRISCWERLGHVLVHGLEPAGRPQGELPGRSAADVPITVASSLRDEHTRARPNGHRLVIDSEFQLTVEYVEELKSSEVTMRGRDEAAGNELLLKAELTLRLRSPELGRLPTFPVSKPERRGGRACASLPYSGALALVVAPLDLSSPIGSSHLGVDAHAPEMAYAAMPASLSVSSITLSQLEAILWAIRSSSARFRRATSAVWASPARSARRSSSS